MNYFEELQQTLSRLDPAPLLAFVQACQGTLWLAGNGGSASTAQHWACDLSKRVGRRAVALGSNPAALTAWANDKSYISALGHEFASVARQGDALICLSCSGTSPNILTVIERARDSGVPIALVTGRHPPASPVDVAINVPHHHFGIIEDCHLAIGHYLTEALCSR